MTKKSTLLIMESLSSCKLRPSASTERDSTSILDFPSSSLPFHYLYFLSSTLLSFFLRFTLPRSLSTGRRVVEIETSREKNILTRFRRSEPIVFRFLSRCTGDSQSARQAGWQAGGQAGRQAWRLSESRIRRGLSRSCLLFFLLPRANGDFYFSRYLLSNSTLTCCSLTYPRIVFNEMDPIASRSFTNRMAILWSSWLDLSSSAFRFASLHPRFESTDENGETSPLWKVQSVSSSNVKKKRIPLALCSVFLSIFLWPFHNRVCFKCFFEVV